jgi:CIC family chloride channel protein
MRDAPQLLPAKMSVHDAAERMQSSEFRTWLVEDAGEIVGVLSEGTVESALAGGRAGENLMRLCESLEFPHVHPDHPLTLALERMSKAHLDILPVVNRANIRKLEGIVTLHDVLGSYGVDSVEPS